ncbi:hypothetical protein [Chryseobacterium sp. MP_3.2]|uniref:hypothetical protein n=1 Tax=Chryseobacterium sp. MP_3.2 TaxID=3071712 RepID=UPI002E029621|nr:putative phage gp36 major capsid-like protein [Chryseobacterium sp. MP_3.2]
MENKKPDLTNYKNIFNYVVYGLAGIVSILYLKSNSKENQVVDTINTALEKCEEENKEYRADNRQLIQNAYNLKQSNLKKDTIIMNADSLSAEKLKNKVQPFLNKIKKYTK